MWNMLEKSSLCEPIGSSRHFSEEKKSLDICDVKTVYGELFIYIMIITIYCIPIRFQELCQAHYLYIL